MDIICNDSLCFGCSVCHDICPKDAISIDFSTGFWRPNIEKSICINCGLCKKYCPSNNIADAELLKKEPLKCYASWSKDENIHFNSASGGLAYEFSKFFIENGGCVAGCSFEIINGKLLAKHILVDNLQDLKKLSRSKYVLSKKDDIYKVVAEESKTRKVLFIGVSCEVFGLYQYLKAKNHDTTNVYTIHLLCRGGSSPSTMTSHIQAIEKKLNRKITNVTFRGGEYNCQFVAYDGDEIIYKDGQFHDEYFFGFMAHTLYQPICHKCPFAEKRRISDITLADFQGLNKEIESKSEGKGNSLVLVHNEKGQELLNSIMDKVFLYERPFEEAVRENTTLSMPTEEHKEREILWYYINKIGFDRAIHKVYWRWYLKSSCRALIYALVPKFVKRTLKKIWKRK